MSILGIFVPFEERNGHNNEPIELCKNGFHYFNNIDNLFIYFEESCFFNEKYRIFEIKPEGKIIEKDFMCCCSEITLTRELSFEDLIDYDSDGRYTYYYALYNNNKLISLDKLEDIVIEKDKTCKLCYLFAQYVKGANINKLEDAVIENDKTGQWCYWFVRDVKDANISKLEDAVIEKDETGEYCYLFAKNIKGANISKLQDAVIEKDTTGEWYRKFAKYNCY
jgi:hypothetical protein